jgi:hypothetical protein
MVVTMSPARNHADFVGFYIRSDVVPAVPVPAGGAVGHVRVVSEEHDHGGCRIQRLGAICRTMWS